MLQAELEKKNREISLKTSSPRTPGTSLKLSSNFYDYKFNKNKNKNKKNNKKNNN